MKGLRSIPRVLKINYIEGRSISLMFNNGEYKIIDIEQFLQEHTGIKPGSLADQVLSSDTTFTSVEVMGNTIGWPSLGIHAKDPEGKATFYPFDLDPLMLFKAGQTDEWSALSIGSKIRKIRKEMGLTQQQLADRTGTTKPYISKLENSKSDIEVLTLRKVVEAGLNKKLFIEIK